MPRTARALRSRVDLTPETLEFLVARAALAPSPDNNQPWRFRCRARTIEIFCDPDKRHESDPHHAMNVLSLGACVENVRLAAGAVGYQTEVAVAKEFDPSQPCVTIELRDGGELEPNHHFVPLRRTDRSAFRAGHLPAEIRTSLLASVARFQPVAALFDARSTLDAAARALASLEVLRFRVGSTYRDLYRALVFSRQEYAQRRSGILVDHLSLSRLERLGLKLLRTPFVRAAVARINGFAAMRRGLARRLASSAAFICITPRDGSLAAQVEAGQALQSLWLTCTRLGLSVQPLAVSGVFARLTRDAAPDLDPVTQRQAAGLVLELGATLARKPGEAAPALILRVGLGAPAPARSLRQAPTYQATPRAVATGETVPVARLVPEFRHQDAFCRNIGLVSAAELAALSAKTVAIPGMGGVGGIHLMTLARMGIGGFHIADADHFTLSNLNRQYGATTATLGANKSEVMRRMVLEVNPHARLRCWDEPVNAENVEGFLMGADLVVDSLDAFAIEERRALYNAARRLGIPVVAAGPLGFGAAMLIFTPRSLSFDEYFNISDRLTDDGKFYSYITGVAPRPFFLKYFDTSRISDQERHGPSSAAGIALCAGVVGAETLKLLLGRGKTFAVPHYHCFDAYLGRYKRGYMPGGNRHPLQRLKFRVLCRIRGVQAYVRGK